MQDAVKSIIMCTGNNLPWRVSTRISVSWTNICDSYFALTLHISWQDFLCCFSLWLFCDIWQIYFRDQIIFLASESNITTQNISSIYRISVVCVWFITRYISSSIGRSSVSYKANIPWSLLFIQILLGMTMWRLKNDVN